MRNSIKEFIYINATFTYLLRMQEIYRMRRNTHDGRFGRRVSGLETICIYYSWRPTFVWNYNWPLVRQSTKLVHSSSQRNNYGRGRKCHLWIRNKGNMNDLIAADKIVDMLFVFNIGKYSEKFNCVLVKMVYFYFIW